MQRIEEVPWHRLHHAYGTCEQFPEVLRRLPSADPRDRSWARNWLEELLPNFLPGEGPTTEVEMLRATGTDGRPPEPDGGTGAPSQLPTSCTTG